MKNIVYILLVFIALLPTMVKADDFEYQIEAKVELQGKSLEDQEFSFQLIDSDGNILQTKKNDGEGNIIFDSISFDSSEVTITVGSYDPRDKKYGYKFYIVRQLEENKDNYKYDLNDSYVGVYIYEDGTSEVHYLKDLDKMIDEWTYEANRDENKIFHATEEQLEGQAYAVFDRKEKTLTFFRDEPNKYQNGASECDNSGTYEGCLEYFTDFEGETLNARWSNYNGIKKIIFKDPIRPKHIARNKDLSTWGSSGIGGWFYSIDDLEEIENIDLLDTSLVDSFNSLFANSKKLKKLDLSSWDTSNVEDMHSMFSECESLEDLNIDNFDTSKVVHFDYMFYETKINKFDASIIDTSSLRRANNMFDGVDGIQGLDFNSWTMHDWYGTAGIINRSNTIRFIDISSFDYITSNGIAMNKQITILKMAGKYYDFSSSFGCNGLLWYNINNNTLYNYNELKRHLVDLKDLEPATYVRPESNPNPSIFKNNYIGPIEEKIELKLSARMKLSSIIPRLESVEDEIIWNIDDTTIISIQNNEIIPLKVGETDAKTEIESQEISVHIKVTEDDLLVPDTSKNFSKIIFVITAIIFAIGILSIKLRKKDY